MIEQLLTDRDLCKMLALSRVSTWRLRKQGKLRFLKLDQGIRYTQQHVASFISQRENKTQAE